RGWCRVWVLLGDVGVGAGAVDGVDDVAGLGFVLGVVVGVGGDLDLLGGLGQGHVLPAVDLDQALEELGGGVVGVLDLLDGAPPAGGRALLEQAEGVVVVVGAEVADV